MINTVTQKPVQNIIRDNMLGYSAYVLLDRALPDLRDGFKPGQRRIIVAMNDMKAYKFTKSANVTGFVMQYHPHGDSYPTVVNMVQKDNQNIPFILGKGNFAQHTSRDMQPGANRYTEIKLAEVAKETMANIKKGMVDIVPNYDGTLTMPQVLPVKFPVILSQVAIGIGVGFSSSIPSYNLIELAEAMEKYINTGEKTLLYPDFATGGYVSNDIEAATTVANTGSGSYKLRGKAEIVGNEIQITEIPYTTNREVIIEKIIELAKTEKLKEIVDIKDLTGLHGQLIEIRCRKNTDMQNTLNKLYKLTPLESNFSANMNMLVEDLPRVMGIWETIDVWLEWRKECIIRGLQYDTSHMKKNLHLLKGLEKVLLDIDSAIDIIRSSSEETMIPNLMQKYGIDEIQAGEVSNMKLKYINRDYILKKLEETANLEKKIRINEKAMSSQSILNQIIIKGLKDSAQAYGTPRKTQIVEMNNIGKIKIEAKPSDNYDVTIKLTKDGYLYKFKHDKEPNLKTGDKIVNVFTTKNNAEILAFSSDGDCFKVKLNEIEETKSGQFGTYIPAHVEETFEIVGYSVLDSKYKFLVHVFENKKVAKIDLTSFIGNRKKLKNSLFLGAKLISTRSYITEDKFTIIMDKGELNCNTADFNMSAKRNAQGAYATNKKGIVLKTK